MKPSEATTEVKLPLSILWVEDDDSIRENAKMIVELLDHRCDAASSGKMALEYLSKNKYDIVITDIGMPEMSGWELADVIKETLDGKMKVAVVSGWSVGVEEKEAHGVLYDLPKPFTIDQLEKFLLTI
jgi:CheY-like chemotaxis protein